MDDNDPISQFFPDQDDVDLYQVLNLTETASLDEIKKAYRKLALQHHPDKAGNSEESVLKFQQIGFAYAVLSDPKRKQRYDDSGRTDENFFEGEADWNAYFKELWKGEVNQKTLDDFVSSYQGSEEEREDILAAYTASSGSLDAIFDNVMCSNVLADEERFIGIVEDAIKAKDVKAYTQWKKDVKDAKGREKRKKAAKDEAAEAEELAKELGVHDKLFGSGSGKQQDGANGDKKGKKKAAKKSGGNVNEDGVDEDALKALIQSRQGAKQSSMNALIESLEAKYGKADGDPFAPRGKKGKKAAKEQEEEKDKKDKKRSAKGDEPTEEEFLALQAKMFGGKEKEKMAGSTAKKGKSKKNIVEDDEEDEILPAPKKKLRRAQ